MADKKNETKKADANPFFSYGDAMKKVVNDPSAVEWQNAQEAAIVASTAPEALAAHVGTPAAADALLAQLKGAYATSPLTLTVIGAVTQYVMEFSVGRSSDCAKLCAGGKTCCRCVWQKALDKAFRATKDEYIQTFILDQLRWCGCKCRAAKVRALADVAASKHVKEYIDWAASEIDGSAF